MENNKKKIVVLSALSAVVLFTAFVGTSCNNRDDDFEKQSEISEQEYVDMPESDDLDEQTTISEQKPDGVAELEVLSTTEDSDWMVVETTYGTVRYPFAFSDIIAVKAVNEETSSQLQFFVVIEDEEIAIYTVHYNSEDGILCGTLKLSDDTDEVTVSVVFEDAPESLAEDWSATFYAAQETFNDVISSMSEDSRFTAAE